MRAVDGAFCRWAALLRQQPGELLRSWLGASTMASSSTSSRGSAAQEQASTSAGPSAPPAATPQQPGSPPGMDTSQPPQHAACSGHRGASRFVLDYINDDQLGPLRMRFAAVRLRPAEGLRQLVRSGAAYAERLQAHGVWDAWLGGGSRGAPAAGPPAA